jgi:hypothetical protein
MGIFQGSGINEASMGRKYLDAGGYVVRILKIGEKSAAESHKGIPCFFVEIEVVQSTEKSCPAGSLASWAQPLKPGVAYKPAISNIKQFLAATIGMMTIFDTPDPVTGQKMSAEAVGAAATSAAQPFAGRLVGVKVTNTKTREGSDFSRHDWFPIQ